MNKHSILAVLVSSAATVAGSWELQQGTPGQPETNPPRDPRNPDQRPRDPERRPNQPDRPGLPDGRAPERLRDQDRTADRRSPFAFSSPDDEARFAPGIQELLRRERRLDQSRKDLMKRLGETRQLSGERQSAALLDLMQDILKQQEELQQYLVESRMAWSGDIRLSDDEDNREVRRDDRRDDGRDDRPPR